MLSVLISQKYATLNLNEIVYTYFDDTDCVGESKMWCKTCNIETNEERCPVCGSATVEDLPTEVYWCAHCEVPVIQVVTQADKGFCPYARKK